MSNRLIAGLTISIIGFLLLGLGNGSQSQATAAASSPTFYEWGVFDRGVAVSGPSYNVNAIRVIRGANRGRTRLEYMTGGEAGIVDADSLASARTQLAPDRMVEERQHENVVVRLWAFEGQDFERSADFTLRTAKTLHLATTQVWPEKPTSVQVDIYVMSDGAAYSLARRVRWNNRQPLELAIFIPLKTADAFRDVATHELYHVLAALRRVGQWADDNKDRLNLSSGLEEVAAALFSSCGALLADGYLSRPREKLYVVNGVPIRPPLSGAQVRQFLAWLRATDANSQARRRTSNAFGGLLDSTPVFHVFEPGQERIELHSPQGKQLLELCRELPSDPMKIEHWLEKLD
jgi:hypothetical protein